MSRIRSQLDTILTANSAVQGGGQAYQTRAHQPVEPRPAFAPRHHQAQPHPAQYSQPAPQYAPQASVGHNLQMHTNAQANSQASRDLDALHQSLAQLSQKIASLPQQTASRTAQASAANVQDQTAAIGQVRDTLANEIRNGFGEFRNDLAHNRGEMERTIAEGFARSGETIGGSISHSLSADLQRISNGIARLQDNNNMHPDYVDQMQAELGSLNAGIGQLLGRPASQVDLSGVSAAIENNYSDIVNKLDAVLASRGNELPRIDIPDYSSQLNNINDRLDEVTRAVVTLSVNPDNTYEHHAFERIEARLASLSKSVDEIMETSQTQPTAFQDNSSGETISAQISKLSEKLDNMGAMGAAGDALGNQIFPDVQEIANRIDTLQNDFGILAANLEEGFATQAQMQSSIAGGMPVAAMPDAALAGIEERLGELAARFDEINTQPDTGSNATGQEILSVLREVVERIGHLEEMPEQTLQAEASGLDDGRFSALESQLAGIAAQLGSLPAPAAHVSDFTPITERLDHIEGQIASSRDIVIEIATEAAQKAAAAGGTGENGDLALASVLEELRALREEQAAGSANAASAGSSEEFNQIGSTMAAIAERLSHIEMSVQAGGTLQQRQAEFAPVQDFDRNHGQESMYAHGQNPNEAYQDTAYTDHAHEGMPLAGSYETPASDFELPNNRAEAREMPNYEEEAIPSINDAPSIDMSMDQGNEVEFGEYAENTSAFADESYQPASQNAEADDVPLAPGSGMPDLEALVKRATNRKKGNAESAASGERVNDEGISDLMAAARRAAQAASIEAELVREAAPKKKVGIGNKMPKLSAPSFLSKKTLMMSAAVIALAVGGLAVGSKLFGSGEQNTEISSLEETETMSSSENTTDETMAEEATTEETLGGEATRIVGLNEDAAEADNGETLAGDEETEAANASAMELSDSDGDAVPASLDSANAEVTTGELPSEELGNIAFRQAIAAGDGNALFEAGKRYTDGDIVPRDLQQAVKWYSKAAEAGHAPAQYRLGNFFEKGHGVEADPATAAKWYEKAATQGNALAMHNLAVLNAMGVVSGDADMVAAIDWFEKAANLGVKDSQVNLGILYTKGMGVKEDLEKAYKWFAIASKGGDSDAAKKRDTVAQAMRPEQLESARGAAEIWKPTQLDAAANVARVKDDWNPGGQKKAMSQAEMVRMTQALLSKAGYDAGPADGKMGSKTRNAIMEFQKANGMNADGAISAELMDALTKISI